MKYAAYAAVAIAAGCLALAAFLPGEPTDDNTWNADGTSYSPGPSGVAAFYLLLEQLGVPVSRLRRPDYARLPPDAALWNLSKRPLGALERGWVLDFVRRGGTFLAGAVPMERLMSEASLGEPTFHLTHGSLRSLAGLPANAERFQTIGGLGEPSRVYLQSGSSPVVASWSVGKGRLIFLGIGDALQNGEIGTGTNGSFFVNLALDAGARQVFDEFAAGFGDLGLGTLLRRGPYRYGLAQAVLALGVLLIAFAGRRLPVRAPDPIRRRQTMDHVDAVARLWERSRDPGLPLESLLRAATDRARARHSPAPSEEAFVGWVSLVRPELGQRAAALWARATGLVVAAEPREEDCRSAAAELARLEEEVLLW
jgi:hypothetical protein